MFPIEGLITSLWVSFFLRNFSFIAYVINWWGSGGPSGVRGVRGARLPSLIRRRQRWQGGGGSGGGWMQAAVGCGRGKGKKYNKLRVERVNGRVGQVGVEEEIRTVK